MSNKARSLIGLVALSAALLLLACSGKKEQAQQEPQESAPKSTVPVIAAAQPVFNFGKIKQGVDVEHVFKINNKGSVNLEIEKARGS